MNDLAQPPAEPNLTVSPREAWPKSSAERDAAKELIKQAYNVAHDDNYRISWCEIKTKDPELYDKVMYWAADVPQHFHSLANDMRQDGDLPTPPTRLNTPRPADSNRRPRTYAISDRFTAIDRFILTKQDSFPRDAADPNIIDWPAFKRQYPAKWKIIQMLWPGLPERGQYRNFRTRMSFVTERAKAASNGQHKETAHAPKGIHALADQIDAFIIEHSAKIPRKGKQIDWPKFEREFPDFLKVLQKRYVNYTYRNMTAAFAKTIVRLVGKSERPVVHRPRPEVPAAQSQPETEAIPVPAIPKPTDVFRFICCPICRLDVATMEQTMQARMDVCPRCKFHVQLAEEAYVARMMITTS